MKVDIVWFKRDFRLEDHAPINEVATSNNNFLGIFVIEPSRLSEKDTDPIHIDWEIQCAVELQSKIRELGGEMLILHDETINVFENLILVLSESKSLNNLSSELVKVELSSPNRAGLISPINQNDENNQITMLVMPIMLS